MGKGTITVNNVDLVLSNRNFCLESAIELLEVWEAGSPHPHLKVFVQLQVGNRAPGPGAVQFSAGVGKDTSYYCLWNSHRKWAGLPIVLHPIGRGHNFRQRLIQRQINTNILGGAIASLISWPGNTGLAEDDY